ncbi:MAG: hypothetical protein RL344_550, partial [Pseudomonadota bacterium]
MTDTKKIKRNKLKKYSEAEIVDLFQLSKIKPINPLMQYWLNTETVLSEWSSILFNK